MQGRIEALEARHRSLEDRIFEEDHRPAPDAVELARLKGEKLKLKDELERLRLANPKDPNSRETNPRDANPRDAHPGDAGGQADGKG